MELRERERVIEISRELSQVSTPLWDGNIRELTPGDRHWIGRAVRDMEFLLQVIHHHDRPH